MTRIKRHDIPADVYTASEVIDIEGNSTQVWTKLHTVEADWQPLSSKSKLIEFGLDPASTGLKVVYSDLSSDFPLNSVSVIGGKKYQAGTPIEWYSHAEVAMTPWPGSLT